MTGTAVNYQTVKSVYIYLDMYFEYVVRYAIVDNVNDAAQTQHEATGQFPSIPSIIYHDGVNNYMIVISHGLCKLLRPIYFPHPYA